VKLIECVPNFSEGRNLAAIDAIRDRIAAVPRTSVLHVTADASHNRSVITFVAPADAMVDAALAAIRAARDHIDLTRHTGVHPRIGAADVVPFIPLDGATMDDCIAIARLVGERVGNELGIPVYLYENAATRPSRRNLAEVRRGGFETLIDTISADTDRAPDFGPSRVHPTAGAVAIGARPFLIAFNCYIGDATHVASARSIAHAIRESGGGVPGIKALGLEVDGQAQVSMNIVDIERASLLDAYLAVDREARTRDLEVTWSEIIGLVPERAAFEVTSRLLKLRDDAGGHVLERQLLKMRTAQSLPGYLDSVADADAFPGGGSVAAIAGALAAALARMVAGLTIGRARYASADAEMRVVSERARQLTESLQSLAIRDAEAYAAVVDAQKLPNTDAGDAAHREIALQAALAGASAVPLEACRACESVARLAEAVVLRGNPNAITDAGVAASLANAGCVGASYNVRVNLRSLTDKAAGAVMAEEAVALARSANEISERVARVVEDALGLPNGS
jgi:glutamate formiminotransferase/formiminotetrahydrofolate cyclodeaminase